MMFEKRYNLEHIAKVGMKLNILFLWFVTISGGVGKMPKAVGEGKKP